MSLLGFDAVGSATINGLTEVNANNVWSGVLYYDADTVPVNVKTAIGAIDIDVTTLEGQMVTANSNISTLQGQMTTANSNISTLQGQMTTANSNISTLQGQYSTLNGEVNTLQSEMNTAQSDINTLQSEMNTAQSDINTLQSEMNTAQSDIIALYSTTATTAAAVAGLAISQAAQDVTLAAHTASIGTLNGQVGTLQGQMSTAQSNITALEVKTVDMSWTTVGKTAFSTKVSVGGNVVLNTATPSTFTSGISCSTFSTSSTADIGGTLTVADTTFIGRANAGQKKLVMYDNGTGNNFQYLGMSVSNDGFNQFLNYNVNTAASEHRFIYGNSSTTAKQILSLNPTNTSLTTNAIDLRAKDITSANRDAGITISNNSSLSADLGTLGLYAGVINVGTQAAPSVVNIGALGSFVNIVGVVNIPNGQNFSMINSFFQQF
jgi:chaperonin cofactor prefoldin